MIGVSRGARHWWPRAGHFNGVRHRISRAPKTGSRLFGFRRMEDFSGDQESRNEPRSQALMIGTHRRILRSRSHSMRQPFSRAVLLVLLVLLAVVAGRPYLDSLLFAATTPRPVAARGDLAETERATIGLFERVSPSVVQVVGVTTGSGSADAEGEGG